MRWRMPTIRTPTIMGKSAMESFNIQMRLSLFGIGALLQSEDGYCKIMELTPGGPADQERQDSKSVTGSSRSHRENKEPVDVVDMKIDKIVEVIRGSEEHRSASDGHSRGCG